MEAIMDVFNQADLSTATWVLLLVILIGFPIESEIATRFTKPRIIAGRPNTRLYVYYYTAAFLWFFAFAVLALALSGHVGWAELGFRFVPDAPTLITCVICAIVIGLLGVQLYKIHTDRALRGKYREAMTGQGEALYFLPTTQKEYRFFSLLGVTAGITEEIIFRGFLIWALATVMPLWVAALFSLLVFTFMHRYQGAKGMAQVLGIASVITVLYVISGSLYPLIILHIAVDVLNNMLLWRARQPEGDDPQSQAADGLLEASS